MKSMMIKLLLAAMLGMVQGELTEIPCPEEPTIGEMVYTARGFCLDDSICPAAWVFVAAADYLSNVDTNGFFIGDDHDLFNRNLRGSQEQNERELCNRQECAKCEDLREPVCSLMYCRGCRRRNLAMDLALNVDPQDQEQDSTAVADKSRDLLFRPGVHIPVECFTLDPIVSAQLDMGLKMQLQFILPIGLLMDLQIEAWTYNGC